MGMRGKFNPGDNTTVQLIYVDITLNGHMIGVASVTTQGGITLQPSPITGSWHRNDRAKYLYNRDSTETTNSYNAVFFYSYRTSDMTLKKNGGAY